MHLGSSSIEGRVASNLYTAGAVHRFSAVASEEKVHPETMEIDRSQKTGYARSHQDRLGLESSYRTDVGTGGSAASGRP